MEVQEMLWSDCHIAAKGLTSSIICAVILPENVWLWRPFLLPFWCPFWDGFWLVTVTANSTPSYSSATCISERLYIRCTYQLRKSTVLAWLLEFWRSLTSCRQHASTKKELDVHDSIQLQAACCYKLYKGKEGCTFTLCLNLPFMLQKMDRRALLEQDHYLL